jgi:hypothetical protein
VLAIVCARPTTDLPGTEDLADCARNTVYVGGGLAATTVERLQALSTQRTESRAGPGAGDRWGRQRAR